MKIELLAIFSRWYILKLSNFTNKGYPLDILANFSKISFKYEKLIKFSIFILSKIHICMKHLYLNNSKGFEK